MPVAGGLTDILPGQVKLCTRRFGGVRDILGNEEYMLSVSRLHFDLIQTRKYFLSWTYFVHDVDATVMSFFSG